MIGKKRTTSVWQGLHDRPLKLRKEKKKVEMYRMLQYGIWETAAVKVRKWEIEEEDDSKKIK